MQAATVLACEGLYCMQPLAPAANSHAGFLRASCQFLIVVSLIVSCSVLRLVMLTATVLACARLFCMQPLATAAISHTCWMPLSTGAAAADTRSWCSSRPVTHLQL